MESRVTDRLSSGFERASDSAALPPGTVVGLRYELRAVLGSGGSSIVYAAFDRLLKRDVALKILRADRLSGLDRVHVRREVAVARDVQNPHLVRVFDLSESDQLVYLSMELVRGEPLKATIARGALPAEEAVRIARGILEALDALHRHGIVHRDVKPGNVLLTAEGGVKLADFGLARRFGGEESRHTALDAIVGTIEYLSPEQALGRELDARSDLYAVGIVLFEMLSGTVPGERGSGLATLLSRLRETRPVARRQLAGSPAWLGAIVERLLEPDRERRPGSAREVIADLDARRRRLRLPKAPLAAAAALAALAALGAAALLHYRQTRFAHLEVSAADGAAAFEADGRLLWRRADLLERGDFAAGRFGPGGAWRIAAILGSRHDFRPAVRNVVSLLDPQTGAVRERIRLPECPRGFLREGETDLFETSLSRAHLAFGPIDEIVADFQSVTGIVTYVDLYEPAVRRARVVFVARGHHYYRGAADVQRDGKKELIFNGIANPLGWYNAIAAVRLVPPAETLSRNPSPARWAESPDLDTEYRPDRRLSWYCLLPAGEVDDNSGNDVTIDPRRREIALHYRTLPMTEKIGFDGFRKEDRSTLPAGERGGLRARAYAHLREARRLLAARFFPDALTHAEKALSAAKAANDRVLAQCVERSRAAIVISQGRPDEGERLLAGIWSGVTNPEAGIEVGLSAGRAFQLAGDDSRAVEWYAKALGHGESGNSRWLYPMEEMVLALGELSRWDEARVAIDRYRAAFGDAWPARVMSEYVAWRTGALSADRSFDPRTLDRLGAFPTSYWDLEWRHARGAPPRALLDAARARIGVGYPPEPALYHSLEAVLLERLGRSAAAVAAARAALAEAGDEMRTDVVVHAHFDLIVSRGADVFRRAGLRKEAGDAESLLRRFRAGLR